MNSISRLALFSCVFVVPIDTTAHIIMPNMNINNRKSPIKQQRLKHSNSIPVTNSNNGRMRSTSSMASSYPRMYTNNNNNNHYHYHHYSNTTSPTAMSASSLPAVPLFYSNTYADPPECSSLPQPPDSWYLPSSNVDNLPVKKEKEEEKEKLVEISSTPIKQKSSISPIQQSKQYVPRTCYYTNNNQGFYSPYYSSTTSSYQKFPTQYVSVKA
jgi:hypothetical protein